MTTLLERLYPGDAVTLLAINVLLQITAVILLAMFVAGDSCVVGRLPATPSG